MKVSIDDSESFFFNVCLKTSLEERVTRTGTPEENLEGTIGFAWVIEKSLCE